VRAPVGKERVEEGGGRWSVIVGEKERERKNER